MKELPRFIKFGDFRINAEEIVSYGLTEDEDGEEYIYIETRTSEDIFHFYDDEVDFDFDEKLDELDKLFLIRRPGDVDFQER